MTTATLHRPARNQSSGRPRSRFYEIAQRVSSRFEPRTAAAFTAAVNRLLNRVDDVALRSAVASGSLDQIMAALATGGSLQNIILEGRELEDAFRHAATATGRAGADVLTGATGVQARFNALAPDVVLFARTQAGRLIAQDVGPGVREAVRVVIAMGQYEGLTTVQQARAIREIVGLPAPWARAPLNLRQEILDGHAAAATGRRLSAAEKAQIRSRIKAGTVTEEFADQMSRTYSQRLVNRRAQNIARTENLKAAHHGQHQGWKQAVNDGVLPQTARRIVVVTPDDRLEHWMVPGMNEGGRGMDEPFQAPEGSFLNPPFRPNCRCGVGLVFPGHAGVL